MKKITIIIMLLCVFFHNTRAQEELSYGPIVGVNMASLNKSFLTPVSNYNLGYMVGGNVSYRIMDIIGVSFSTAYATMGGNDIDLNYIAFPTENIMNYQRADVFMHTIDLNLLANIYIPLSFGPIKPKALLGAGNAYNLGTFIGKEVDGPYGVETIFSTEDRTERFTYYDISVVGGLGVDMEIMGFNTSIDARYRIGVLDINNTAPKPELYHSSFALVFGVNF